MAPGRCCQCQGRAGASRDGPTGAEDSTSTALQPRIPLKRLLPCGPGMRTASTINWLAIADAGRGFVTAVHRARCRYPRLQGGDVVALRVSAHAVGLASRWDLARRPTITDAHPTIRNKIKKNASTQSTVALAPINNATPRSAARSATATGQIVPAKNEIVRPNTVPQNRLQRLVRATNGPRQHVVRGLGAVPLGAICGPS